MILFHFFSEQNTHLETNLDALQVRAGCQGNAAVKWKGMEQPCLVLAVAVRHCQVNREHL